MLLRLGLFALTLSTASAAMAMQDMRPPGYTPARTIEPMTFWEPRPIYPVERAGYVFSRCIDRGVRGLDIAQPVETAASGLMNLCAAQLQDVRQEALRAIAAAHWPDARKDLARAQLEARLALVEQRVAARISDARLRRASAAR